MTRVSKSMLVLAAIAMSGCGSTDGPAQPPAAAEQPAAAAPAPADAPPAPGATSTTAPAASAPVAVPAPAPVAAAAPPPAPLREPPPPPPPTYTLPAGTTINVRLTQEIAVDTVATGATFKAIVDDPVMAKGEIAIPREARATLQAVNVEQSGKMKGSDKISLKLNSIGFGGKTHQMVTDYANVQGKGEGKKTTRKVAGGAGLGAIVGGIAGGGKGAAIGAAIGGGGGAAVAASGQEHLVLPAESRLTFTLSSAVTFQP